MIGKNERKKIQYRKELFEKNPDDYKIHKGFTDYDRNFSIWSKFFDLPEVTKDDVILDFGCAVGFSILIGRELGYNVRGVDVEYKGPYKGVDKYREKYGTDKYIEIYDGYNLPYPDNTFTIITSKASLDKFNSDKRNDDETIITEMITKRLEEFDRILTRKRLVISSVIQFMRSDEWESHNIKFKHYKFRN